MVESALLVLSFSAFSTLTFCSTIAYVISVTHGVFILAFHLQHIHFITGYFDGGEHLETRHQHSLTA